MDLATVIAAGVLVAVVCLAVWYLVNQRARGAKCVGCPLGKKCAESARANLASAQADNTLLPLTIKESATTEESSSCTCGCGNAAVAKK